MPCARPLRARPRSRAAGNCLRLAPLEVAPIAARCQGRSGQTFALMPSCRKHDRFAADSPGLVHYVDPDAVAPSCSRPNLGRQPAADNHFSAWQKLPRLGRICRRDSFPGTGILAALGDASPDLSTTWTQRLNPSMALPVRCRALRLPPSLCDATSGRISFRLSHREPTMKLQNRISFADGWAALAIKLGSRIRRASSLRLR